MTLRFILFLVLLEKDYQCEIELEWTLLLIEAGETLRIRFDIYMIK